MGLEKAKSLLTVKDGKSFLDLIADQIKYTRQHYGSKVRFVLMNSFSTSDDTKARSTDSMSCGHVTSPFCIPAWCQDSDVSIDMESYESFIVTGNMLRL